MTSARPMAIARRAALAIATMAFVSGLPAAAQEEHHTVNSRKTVTTVPGHVSTNKVRVVHVKKVVHVPAKPAPAPGDGTVVHKTTVNKSVHKTSSSQ